MKHQDSNPVSCAVCVAIFVAASHNRSRKGSVACICSALKSSLPCQNLFMGIFSISGSWELCICFPLVASVNMMSFFLIILKYCILDEKIAHSFNDLVNCWKMICSLSPHALLTHFLSVFLCFIPFLWAGLTHEHTKFNEFSYMLCRTQTVSSTASPSLSLRESPAALCAGNKTLEISGTREW